MRAIIVSLLPTLFILGCSREPMEMKTRDLVVYDIEDPQTKTFVHFFADFSRRFKSLDTASVRKMALDTISLWDEPVTRSQFIKRYSTGYESSGVAGMMAKADKADFGSVECYLNSPPQGVILKEHETQKSKFAKYFNYWQATIRDTAETAVHALQFTFIETTEGYLLYGLNYYSHSRSPISNMVDTTTIELIDKK